MRHTSSLLPRLVLFTVISIAGSSPAQEAAPGRTVTPEQIVASAEQMADAQLKAIADKVDISWIGAPMYAGIAELSQVSRQKGEAYAQVIRAAGAKMDWGLSSATGAFNAENFTIGQAYLDAYESKRDPAILKPLLKRADELVDRLNANRRPPARLTWNWSDALFMAPPVLARLTAVTGDRKYIDAMDAEWWSAVEALYDPKEHLFYRDKRFKDQTTPQGQKVFWSRGNGWAFAGLARVLKYMPADYPSRDRYVGLFKEMAEKLAAVQPKDGAWRTSLLDDTEFPTPESSGTAFFCYGIAWGVNNGLLEKPKYLPVLARAWAALAAMRRGDALPGWVQSIADKPGPVFAGVTRTYATGAHLLAAVELQKLAPFDLPPIPRFVPPPDPNRPAATRPSSRPASAPAGK